MGFREEIERATLGDVNKRRDWRIYAQVAQRLIARARKLYVGGALSVELEPTAYALKSTVIDLSVAPYPWGPFRATGAAVKLHTLLDLRGNIRCVTNIWDGKLHGVSVLDILVPEAGAIYVMGSCYLDVERLHGLH